MRPVSLSGPQTPSAAGRVQTVWIASRVSLATAWILFTAALFLPMSRTQQNLTGLEALVITIALWWLPPVFPVAASNIMMLTTPLVSGSGTSDSVGRQYAVLLTGAALGVTPWTSMLLQPLAAGTVCWAASFYFASAAFLLPMLCRRYLSDQTRTSSESPLRSDAYR